MDYVRVGMPGLTFLVVLPAAFRRVAPQDVRREYSVRFDSRTASCPRRPSRSSPLRSPHAARFRSPFLLRTLALTVPSLSGYAGAGPSLFSRAGHVGAALSPRALAVRFPAQKDARLKGQTSASGSAPHAARCAGSGYQGCPTPGSWHAAAIPSPGSTPGSPRAR